MRRCCSASLNALPTQKHVAFSRDQLAKWYLKFAYPSAPWPRADAHRHRDFADEADFPVPNDLRRVTLAVR